jgi:hypothetical protein
MVRVFMILPSRMSGKLRRSISELALGFRMLLNPAFGEKGLAPGEIAPRGERAWNTRSPRSIRGVEKFDRWRREDCSVRRERARTSRLARSLMGTGTWPAVRDVDSFWELALARG